MCEHNIHHQRVSKSIDGQLVEHYLWGDLTTLLAILDANGTITQRFHYAGGRLPISYTENGQHNHLHYDQVGTLLSVSNAAGDTIKTRRYDSFGVIRHDSAPEIKLPFGFAGGLYDADTQLTRFGYRDYDAYTGRWTATDPIGFAGGDSNLYGYVFGDPVNFVDPEGLLVGTVLVCEAAVAGHGAGTFFNTTNEIFDESSIFQEQLDNVDERIKQCDTSDFDRLVRLTEIRDKLVEARRKRLQNTTANNFDVFGMGAVSQHLMAAGVCGLGIFTPW